MPLTEGVVEMGRVNLYVPQEKISKFVLRLPEHYSLALDGLVEKGVAKSRNELIVQLVAVFLSDLKRKAEEATRKEKTE